MIIKWYLSQGCKDGSLLSQKFIAVIHHINRLKKKNHYYPNIEKAFYKV